MPLLCGQNLVWLCLAEIRRTFPGKDINYIYYQNPYLPFSFSRGFTKVQVTHNAMHINASLYHHGCWLLNHLLITGWMFPLFFHILTCQATGHFSTSPHSILNHFRPRDDRRFSIWFIYGFLFVPHLSMQQLSVFTWIWKVLLNPFNDAHCSILSLGATEIPSDSLNFVTMLCTELIVLIIFKK